MFFVFIDDWVKTTKLSTLEMGCLITGGSRGFEPKISDIAITVP